MLKCKNRRGTLQISILLVLFIFSLLCGCQKNILPTQTDCIREEVTLQRVVDGDTLIVQTKQSSKLRIRLIGIDTPESVNPDASKNTKSGHVASNYTKKLLKDKKVLYLEYDRDKTDRYGRTLAYVWFDSSNSDLSQMLNNVLVQDGYATAKEYKPNTKYATKFEASYQKAKDKHKGLWK